MKKKLDWFWRSGSSFSPLSLTPTAWWDNGSDYMASDGSQWTDRMGNYNLTASGTARPTYTTNVQNGLPAYVFDGTTDVLAGSRITEIQGVQNITFWMVGKRGMFSHDDLADGNTRVELYHAASDDRIWAFMNTVAVHFGNVAFSNSFAYVLYVYDGTQSTNDTRLKIYINGVQQTVSFTGTIVSTSPSGASAAPRMGRRFGAFQAGQLLEYGIVNRTLAGSEITLLNSYLASKYAL